MIKSKLGKRFLTTFLAVAMVFTSVNLTPFGTVTAHAADPIIPAGDYYIVSAVTGRVLNGGNSWGTHALTSNYGQLMTFKVADAEQNTYQVDSYILNNDNANKHYLNGEWVDDESSAVIKIVSGDDGAYIMNGDGSKYMTAPAADAESTSVTLEESKTDLAKWRILTRQQFLDSAVAQNNKLTDGKKTLVDVTSLIFDAGINRKNTRYDKWTMTYGAKGSSGQDKLAEKDMRDGNQSGKCVELYHHAFDFYQVLENVPNGVYELSVQGFCRQDANSKAAAEYYINDTGKALMTPAQIESGTPANSLQTALDCFLAGKYNNEFLSVMVRDHTLRVGIKSADAENWVSWNGFTLKLKESMDDNELAAYDLGELIDKIGEPALTLACKRSMDVAKAFYDALTPEKKASAAVKAKYAQLQAKETAFQELLQADGGQATFDQACADEVIAKITAIGTVELTDASKEKIDDAREAFDALTESQQAKVSNKTVLTEAEATYKSLKDAADKAAADAVKARIGAIGEVTFTIESRLAIRDAREAFDALTDDQKALVGADKDVLTKAEADYQVFETESERNLKDGDYYIVNAATGRCLNAGNSYQTQGSALTYGQLMTIAAKGNNRAAYTVDTHYLKGGKHFLGGNGYLDSAETTLRIEKCKNGNFVIVNDTDQFLTAPAKDAETTAASLNAEKSPESEWLILDHTQFMEKALQEVTAETPVDVTSLIFDACTDRYNDYHSKWDKVITTAGKNAPLGGKDTNPCVEFYMGEGDISQTIQNVPNGQYELSVQGYYRAEEQDAAPVVYYINDVEGNLKSVWAEGKTEATGGWATKKDSKDFDNTGLFIPDSQSNASDCFTAGGYINEFITATVTDHTLKVGIKTKDAKSWMVFDKFTLRLKNVDVEIAERVAAKINAIGTVELSDECKALIDAARTAYDALNDTQKALISEEQLKVLTDAEAEYNRLFEESGGQAELDRKAVENVVKKINAIGTVEFTDESKAKIKEARDAYEALNETRQAMVTQEQLKVLTDAEAEYTRLKNQADQDAADGVKSKIAAIGTVEMTLDCRLAIKEARDAYTALTAVQKALVDEETLQALTKAEEDYAAIETTAERILPDDDYYIVNASTGGYLNAGNGYQTQASVRDYGQLMTIAAMGDNRTSYTVDSHYNKDGKHFLADNGYLDGKETALKIELCKMNGTFTISNTSGHFLTAPAEDADTTITAFKEEKSAESEWYLLTRDELIEVASEGEKPADLTSLVFDAGIDRYNEYYSKWIKTVTTEEKSFAPGGKNENQCVEFYMAEGEFSQTIEGIPNGEYELSVQGYYRPEEQDAVSAVYYINDVEGNLKTVWSEGKESAEGGWAAQKDSKDFDKTGLFIPDSHENASDCFASGGYKNEFITAMVTDNTLQIGIKTKDAKSWVAFDKFTLRLIRTDKEIAAEVVKLIKEIGAVDDTEECGDRIQRARDAYEALTDAQQEFITEDELEILTNAENDYKQMTTEKPATEELKGEASEAVQKAEAEALVQEAYTTESWSQYETALDELKKLSAKADVKQGELKDALKAFKAASDELEVKEEYKPSDEDKQTLTTTITDAGNVKAEDYKEDENWTAFQKALARAQEINSRPNATKAQVQKAMDDLKAAIAKLTPAKEEQKADKTALDKAIRDYGSLKAADYTPATWNAFKTALDAAKRISAKADATQAEVNAALTTLNAKKQALRKPVKVSKIKISADYTKVAAGKKVTLKASVTPTNAANRSVTWSVDKTAKSKKYASINSKGLLTTNKKGAGKTVTVTAAAKDGSGKKATIKIKIMKGGVKSVSLKAKSKKVKAGKKLTVKATVKVTSKKKSDANTKLTWKTSNKKVATVNSKGVVTGKKAGKVTITATSTDGTKKSGKIKLTVVKK